MYINKYLKKMNIEPISEIRVKEKCEFANKVAMIMTDSLIDYNLDYLRIVDILQHTGMYIAKIPKNLSPVNYSYLDMKIYISDNINLDSNNEYVLHEVIHRIQEYRNKKEKLIQLGLCDVMETKIKGLALNEAAIQYIVQKVLKGTIEIVDIYNMRIPTISKNYYPILTNLIEQIAFLVGDDKLIDSTLNSNNEFKYETIDILGEDVYNSIEKSFEQILETKNLLLKDTDQSIFDKNVDLIKKVYIDTQSKIMNSYFSNQFKKIKNTEQLKDFSNKLVDYRQYIGSNEGQVLYSEFFQNMQDKIKEKEQSYINKALIVVKENKFTKVYNKIKNYFKSLVFQN